MKNLSSKWLGAIVAAITAISVVVAAPASAEIIDHIYSPTDDFNHPGISPYYDIDYIETALDSNDSDLIYFWIMFKQPITARQFVYGSKEPWAAISLFREEPIGVDEKEDFQITTSSTEAYSGNYSITATAWGNQYSGDPMDELTGCNAETWTNLDTGAKWIGFSISRSCANIPDEFWLAGYTEADDNNTSTVKDWDYAPSSPWYVDISGSGNGGYDETYTEPQTIYFYQAPDILLTKKTTKVTAYADSGLDVYFESLTPKVCKSVNYTNSIKLLAVGTCKLSANQDGDDNYDPADTRYMSFKVVKAGTRIKPVPKVSPTPTAKATPKVTPKAPGSVGGKPKT